MIKSKLLTSTALISAAVFMTASNANALSLKLGGTYEAWVGWAANQDANRRDLSGTGADGRRSNFDVKTDSEIHFRAEETLANGLKVGALLEMESGNGDDQGSGAGNNGRTATGNDTDFDESFAWVKSKWGQLNIGNNDVAAAYVGGVSTVGPVGITKSDASDWLPGEYALNNSDVDLGIGDAGNVTYFTPQVGGVQLIVSYMPDRSDWGVHEKDFNENQGSHHVWSGAVKFGQKFGSVGVGIGAGYTQLKNANTGGGGSITGSGNDNLQGYNTKGSVSFGPAKVDVVYSHENLGNRQDSYWAASGVYKINSMNKVSVGYADSARRAAGGSSERNNSKLFTTGFSHNMGKGVAWESSIFYANVNGATDVTDDNKGLGMVSGLKLKF